MREIDEWESHGEDGCWNESAFEVSRAVVPVPHWGQHSHSARLPITLQLLVFYHERREKGQVHTRRFTYRIVQGEIHSLRIDIGKVHSTWGSYASLRKIVKGKSEVDRCSLHAGIQNPWCMPSAYASLAQVCLLLKHSIAHRRRCWDSTCAEPLIRSTFLAGLPRPSRDCVFSLQPLLQPRSNG